MMGSFQGVAKILRFNWSWYALGLAANVAAAWAFRLTVLPGPLRLLAGSMAGLGDLWLVASLAVSHWIYDRSGVARAQWLDDLPPAGEIAIFHGGHDEASRAVAERFPDAHVAAFDFFDADRHREPSLLRARAVTAGSGAATPIRWDAFPLPNGCFDLAFVVFAAHEIRRDADRACFFGEVRRVLKPGGRLIVVEHLRDGWNGLAYGPGAFHFLPRSAWDRTFAVAALTPVSERRLTPFVTVFRLSPGNEEGSNHP